MNLRHLIELVRRQGTDIEVTGDLGTLDREVEAVTSRACEAGPQVIFVVEQPADPGAVDEAVRRGAAALLSEESLLAPVPVLKVHEPREALRHLLSLFHGDPVRKLVLWGVTGPGQTTVAFLLQRCLTEAGLSPGLWTEIAAPGHRADAGRGAGFPAGLMLFLRRLAEQGGHAAVLSLCPQELVRHDGSGPALQGLIALGRRPNDPPMVLPETPLLVTTAGRRRPTNAGSAFTFGPGCRADLRYRRLPGELLGPGRLSDRLSDRLAPLWGQTVEFDLGTRLFRLTPGRETPTTLTVRLATPGPAARRAAAAAAAGALLLGTPPESVAAGLAALPGIWRRSQLVYDGPFAVVDDLAQTPREMVAALAALRELEAGPGSPGRPLYGRLIPVFGLTGRRGALYQAMVGFAAARALPRRRAERLIATESLGQQTPELAPSAEERTAFVGACRKGGLTVDYYPDLSDALTAAVQEARSGDLIMLLGGSALNTAQATLTEILGARGLDGEPYDEWAVGPLLQPLTLNDLTRPENLPGSRCPQPALPVPLV